MIDWLANEAASLLRIATIVALFCAAIWSGIKTDDLASRKVSQRKAAVAGWLVGIAAFFALATIFGPALGVLQKFSCRDARDVELCMDPPDPEYP